MDVRRLTSEDVQIAQRAISLLKAPEGSPTPPLEYLSRLLSRPENVFIVARDDREPVGFAIGYLLDRIDRDQQMMFFYEIGVAESHRRRGVGTAMVNELKAICRDQDVMKMWVPTSRGNLAATRLYTRTGATPLSNDDEVTYAFTRESFAVG